MMAMKFLPLMLLVPGGLLAETLVTVAPDGAIDSLVRARDRVRELRAAGEKGLVRVEFAQGTYAQTEPVAFSAADGGSPQGPTIYAAAPGAKVVITGGKQIGGWQAGQGGLWQTRLPQPVLHFEQMWINGRRAQRARTPNKGYFNAYAAAGAGAFAELKAPEFEAFVARPADFNLVRAIPAAERPDVLLTVMHTWTVGHSRIRELNEQARAIRIVGRARYPFVQHEPDQRWYLENYRAALDEPGEWYLQKDGTVLYWPLPGEDMTKVDVIVPVAEKLVLIDGRDGQVRDLHFRDLTFAHTHASYGPGGHHDGQAASGVGAAIEIDRADAIHLSNCEMRHTGGYGIWFREACSHSSLTHSLLHDLGGGGVRIGTTAMPGDKDLTHHITVDDCILRHGGRRYPSACGVFLAHAADCTVTHNEIHDFFYTGISAGWVWGYAHSSSKRNRFDFNHIHHLGWGVLSDMGGFYGLGRAEGTTVNNNWIHHIASYRYGGWGLYTDEGSSGVTLENNLVHDTSEAGFHQHYGKWNQVSNNIFAFGQKAQIQRSRPETHASFAYERNIVIYDVPALLDRGWDIWQVGTYEMRNNVYWNTAGLPVVFVDTDLAGWQAKTGHDQASVVADPLFEDAGGRDFRLKQASPALKLGFKPFDPKLAGARSPEWRTEASAAYPDFFERSKPWPRPEYEVNETFEGMTAGSPSLPGQELRIQGKGDSITVANDHAANGKASLKFTDAPGLEPVWDPHLVLKPHYTQGTSVVAFDIRTEPGTQLYVECRGEGHPYTTGPSLWIDAGQITERTSKRSIDLPPGVWTRIEMTAGLGAKASGTWTLKVTPAGGQTAILQDLPCDKRWKELHWLGFVSTATSSVSFWIDDLIITRKD
jgi:parallel beta-helix repeat protein